VNSKRRISSVIYRKIVFFAGMCLGVVLYLFLGTGSLTTAAAGSSGYHIIKTIPIGGTEGWDYLAMDSDARILYVSGQNHVDAVNVDTGCRNTIGRPNDGPRY
jgi:hypothetical protein